MGKSPRRVKGLSEGPATLEHRSQRWMFGLERPAYIIADADGSGVIALLADQKVVTTSIGSSNKGRQLRYFSTAGGLSTLDTPIGRHNADGEYPLVEGFSETAQYHI